MWAGHEADPRVHVSMLILDLQKEIAHCCAHSFINKNIVLHMPFSAFVCTYTFSVDPTHILQMRPQNKHRFRVNDPGPAVLATVSRFVPEVKNRKSTAVNHSYSLFSILLNM